MLKPTPSVASSAPLPAGEGLGRGFSEARFVAVLTVVTLLLASLPAALGYAIAPPGFRFVGATYNIDDYCNYLSWLQQAIDGHFFLHNLFTTEAQRGLECNVFFWLLGRLAHALGWSPQAALQFAQVAGGAALLLLAYRFLRFCLPHDRHARLTAFAFVCLSSGWGWLNWSLWQDKNLVGSPVDAWQPEAYTFLSLTTSALFTVSTLLILGALYALLVGEATGRARYAVLAGLCGAVLGNMHSYDVLHLAAAWGLFLVVWTVVRRGRGMAGSWARGVLALALTLPTTLYQYWVFQREAVFHERAEVATLSPAFWHYVLGYGIVFALAVLAVPVVVRRLAPRFKEAGGPPAPQVWPLTGKPVERGAGEDALRPGSVSPSLAGRERSTANAIDLPPPKLGGPGGPSPLLFALCWAVAGLCVIYLPHVAFQRKMLMGTHLPLCLLAGVGAAWLTRRLKARPRTVVLALLVLLSAPSNLFFLRRDFIHLETNRSETLQQPYLAATLLDAFGYVRDFTPPGAAVVSFPTLCAPLPGYTGHPVWAGHWGETPQFSDKVRQFIRFADAATPNKQRRAFLLSTHAEYLLYPNDVAPLAYTDPRGNPHVFSDFAHAPPPYLVPVYANPDLTLLRIRHAVVLSQP